MSTEPTECDACGERVMPIGDDCPLCGEPADPPDHRLTFTKEDGFGKPPDPMDSVYYASESFTVDVDTSGTTTSYTGNWDISTT